MSDISIQQQEVSVTSEVIELFCEINGFGFERGPAGRNFFQAGIDPIVSEGNDYDSWLNNTTWNVFIKVDGVWELVGNIKGGKGDKGDQGDQGEQGIQGIKGEKGEQGVQGIQGLKGDDGKQVELQNNGTYIQRRYVGDLARSNLVLLTDLQVQQIQSDYTQTDTNAKDYIKNKPTIPVGTDYLSKIIYDPDGGARQVAFKDELNGKQATLVSGTNIKTVNGNTLLGSGDIIISGGGAGSDTTAWHWNGDTLGAKKTIGSIDNQDFGIITNNTERITVLKDGKVGIGTTTPNSKLYIAGYLATDKTTSEVGFDYKPLDPPAAGSVTGTSQAGTGLNIGNYYYTVTFYTAIGETEGRVSPVVTTTAGNQKVLLTFPVSTNPAVIGRKIYRVKVNGTNDTGYLLTTIANNTATTYTDSTPDTSLTGSQWIGYSPNTTSFGLSRNGSRVMLAEKNLTLFGYQAGMVAKAPGQGVVIGGYAGYNLIDGFQDTLVGYQAGYSLTTGNLNTAFGARSAFYLTTGKYNTFLGADTGSRVTTGIGNTAIGFQAMMGFVSKTGSYNNSIGYNNQYSVTTGTRNDSLGVSALYHNTTGSYNIAFGYQAGMYIADGSTANTITSNSIFIGYNTRANASSQTNQIVIGDQVTGLGSNTVIIGNSSIIKTVLSGSVGIGTTTPNAKLDVVGITRFGNSTTNYTEFEADGIMKMVGTATTFDDLLGDITQVKTSGTGVTLDTTESTIDFTTASNLSDYIIINYQMSHTWKIGSDIFPHIHWQQNSNATPNFLIQYRWQKNGSAKITAWTNYKCSTTNAFTYVSGTLNQITNGGALTPPSGAMLSDIIQFRVLRDNANTSTVFTGADTYTGDAEITGVDCHYEMDTLGSRSEYTK